MTLYTLLGKALPYMIGAEVQLFLGENYVDEFAEALLDSTVCGFELICDGYEPDKHAWRTDYKNIRNLAAEAFKSDNRVTVINVQLSKLGRTDVEFSVWYGDDGLPLSLNE